MSNKIKDVEKREATKTNLARMFFIVLAILIQFIWFFSLIVIFGNKYRWIFEFSRILALIVVIAIYNSEETAGIKIPWIIAILSFPLPALFLYGIFKLSITTSIMKKESLEYIKKTSSYLFSDVSTKEKLNKLDKDLYNISKYIENYATYPIYTDTDIEYFKDAYLGFEKQLEYLKTAKSFIFMAYFAIEDGISFNKIFDILKEKAELGVEVKIFYDDMGSAGFLNNKAFIDKLEKVGIECVVFNPVGHIFNSFYNHRNHRKITVIDGEVAFTGGYNIADEYFNLVKPYGYWKDTGLILKGKAVNALTSIFFEGYALAKKIDIKSLNLSKYYNNKEKKSDEEIFVLAYADNPLDDEEVAENIYINLLNIAKEYVYIVTPYLIISDDMKLAIIRAAKRGVDVRIITPGIPDKKIVYALTRSFYTPLIKGGVKIYEYSIGFIHAKQMVVDDKYAVCGTINFDYRSLYLNFENAVLFTKSKALYDMKEDFIEMFGISKDVSLEHKNIYGIKKVFCSILRLFAPLM